MDKRDSGVHTYAGTESGPRNIVINCAIKDTVGLFADRVGTDRRNQCSFGRRRTVKETAKLQWAHAQRIFCKELGTKGRLGTMRFFDGGPSSGLRDVRVAARSSGCTCSWR
jgi:hypothetical protein